MHEVQLALALAALRDRLAARRAEARRQEMPAAHGAANARAGRPRASAGHSTIEPEPRPGAPVALTPSGDRVR
jgi:hypothetical protein